MFKQVAKNPTSFNTVISHPNTHQDQKVRLEISNRRNSHQLQTDEALSVDKLTKQAFKKGSNQMLLDSQMEESFHIDKPTQYGLIISKMVIDDYFKK